MNNLLLAYDGSRKGNEALFVSAYLGKRYGKKLTVLVVEDDEVKGRKLIKMAQDYLGDCCEKSIFLHQAGKACDEILNVAAEMQADMILMGGYGHSPILEALVGSTVDGVLRGSPVPVVICQ